MRIQLAVAMLALLCAVSAYGQRGDWYNDEGGFTFQGSGVEEDPYLINSVTALAYLAEQVNMWPGKSFEGESFLLTEDLDLGRHYWIPIGSEPHQPFRGALNGNGKVIRNLFIGSTEVDNVYAAAGLFGHLGNGAKIENLTLEGGLIVGGGREAISRTGCLAAYLLCSVSEGKDSIVIRNCHSRQMKIAGANTETAHTGGLVGEVYSFADGGGQAYVLMENCSNSSLVTASASNFPYTGGLVGKGHGHGYCDEESLSGTGRFVLRGCLNRGDVEGGDAAGTDAVSSTGGILGFGYGSGDGYGERQGSGAFIVEYCLNLGHVTGGDAVGNQAFSYTGGLLGYGDGYGYDGSGACMVQFSANRGDVKGGDTLHDTVAVVSTGGAIGFASGSASGSRTEGGSGYGIFRMRDCYSYASVMAKSGYLGGLAGTLSTVGMGRNHRISAMILDSYAAGSINRSDTVYEVITGGIVGRMQKSKEAAKGPQVGACLAALSYLNGKARRTFRIVGQVQGIGQPFTAILSRNYAYVKEGEWTNVKMIKNGHEWNGSMLSPPISRWNTKEKSWQWEENGRLPKLLNLPWQEDVPLP
ncbi:MAG: hypothetical protein LBB84_11500 [Tannerellaceae bacterium]|jgi:hypothetical protein|nr:hypothetical protein [Tannerellaceae bacterium]